MKEGMKREMSEWMNEYETIEMNQGCLFPSGITDSESGFSTASEQTIYSGKENIWIGGKKATGDLQM